MRILKFLNKKCNIFPFIKKEVLEPKTFNENEKVKNPKPDLISLSGTSTKSKNLLDICELGGWDQAWIIGKGGSTKQTKIFIN